MGKWVRSNESLPFLLRGGGTVKWGHFFYYCRHFTMSSRTMGRLAVFNPPPPAVHTCSSMHHHSFKSKPKPLVHVNRERFKANHELWLLSINHKSTFILVSTQTSGNVTIGLRLFCSQPQFLNPWLSLFYRISNGSPQPHFPHFILLLTLFNILCMCVIHMECVLNPFYPH